MKMRKPKKAKARIPVLFTKSRPMRDKTKYTRRPKHGGKSAGW